MRFRSMQVGLLLAAEERRAHSASALTSIQIAWIGSLPVRSQTGETPHTIFQLIEIQVLIHTVEVSLAYFL